MDNYDSGSRDRPQESKVRRSFDDKIEYLLRRKNNFFNRFPSAAPSGSAEQNLQRPRLQIGNVFRSFPCRRTMQASLPKLP